ncbi:MAG: hypothetical protein ACRCU0_06320 [Candidatus Rhabdochlamydia sp.]
MKRLRFTFYLILAMSSLLADKQENLEDQKDLVENAFLPISIQSEEQLNPLDQLAKSFLGFKNKKQKNYRGLDQSISQEKFYDSKLGRPKEEEDKHTEAGDLYNYFLNSHLKSQFYIEIGGDVDFHMYKEEAMDMFFFKRSPEIHRRPFVELCPKLGLGRKYRSSFLEMQVGFLKIPILFKEDNALVVAFRYGIGF